MDEETRRREYFNFLAVAAAYERDRRHGLWVPPEDAGHGWVRVKLPNEPMFKNAASFQRDVHDGYLSVLLERRPKGHDNVRVFPNGRWHLSVAHNSYRPILPGVNRPGRLPTWEELREARYKFVPDDCNMAIMMPPSKMYYNRHATCIHLLQVPVSLALDPRQKGGL